MISSGSERPRRRRITAALVAHFLAAIAAPAALAHMRVAAAQVPSSPQPAVRAEKVAEGTWCLFGKGGNVGVVATPSALLVVDTQYKDIAPSLLAEIHKLGTAPLKYVINTHFHEDHTGGNGVFAQQGDLVGHENVRRRLYEGAAEWIRLLPIRIASTSALLAEGSSLSEKTREIVKGAVGLLERRLKAAESFDPASVVAPSLLYEDRLRLFLGDEEVEVFHVAPGHTDGDSVVYFPGQAVVHMGDLFWNGMFPFIDVDGGGSSEGWIRTLDSVLERIPPSTKVIAGHGPVAGPSELRAFRAYLADLHRAVEEARSKGHSLAQALDEIQLGSHAAMTASFQSLQSNILQVWEEMDRAAKAR